MLPDEVRARENLDPMAIVEAELEAELPPGLQGDDTADEPAAELAPAVPAVADGPATGNDAFAASGAAGNPKGTGA
jgi:hypothetical protein